MFIHSFRKNRNRLFLIKPLYIWVQLALFIAYWGELNTKSNPRWKGRYSRLHQPLRGLRRGGLFLSRIQLNVGFDMSKTNSFGAGKFLKDTLND